MKLIISFLFFILFSCEQIPKNKILNKIETTKNIIEEKTTNSTNEKKELKKKIKENKINEDNIFYLIGNPYYIEGVKYIPEENYSYQEVGLATYYDKELHNKKTANNDLNKVTELLGRHKTLPLPSIVKITNLENGLSLTIKIVDRHDDNPSIIQVSRKVAQLLRFYKNKITKVKVEILSDPSRQWKNVIMSINDNDFNNLIESSLNAFNLWSKFTPLKRSRVLSKYKEKTDKESTVLIAICALSSPLRSRFVLIAPVQPKPNNLVLLSDLSKNALLFS